MSWKDIKIVSSYLITKYEIDKLERSLPRCINNYSDGEKWLISSERIVKVINDNIPSLSSKTILLGMVRYLRCFYFWCVQDWNNVEAEVDKGLKEDNRSAIFSMIKGFCYLQPLVNYNNPMLNVVFSNEETSSRKKLLTYAKLCFDEAHKNVNNEQMAIRAAIRWSNAWMFLQIGRKDKAEECAKQAWKLDGDDIGAGWKIWIQWLGRILKPEEHCQLLECFRKID